MGRFTGILGILIMLGLAFAFSTNRRAIRVKTVAWGLGLQAAFAVFVLKADIGRRVFQKAGGKDLHAIPCLNEQPGWLAALTDLAFRHLGGWLERPPDASARERTLLRAKVVGAKS